MNIKRSILSQVWLGPMGGVPPLDQVNSETLRVALDEALIEAQNERSQLKAERISRSFNNTILVLDQLGESLDRVRALYSNWSSSFTNDEMRMLRRDMEPRLSAWQAELYGDSELYQGVLEISKGVELTPIQRRLSRRILDHFEDAGAHLDVSTKTRVTEINRRLSELYTDFSDRVLADEEEVVTWLDDGQLDGLSLGWCSSAKNAAERHGQPQRWAVQNTRSAVEPLLTFSPHSEVREAVWRNFYGRGELRESTKTYPIAQEILILRAERATLLGFETQSHQVLSRTMAGTPEAAMGLLREVWKPTVDTFSRELHTMSELAKSEGFEGVLAPWDVRYYGEKVRQRDYDLDPNLVRQYFSLNRLREGMFWAANQCFGWQIKPAIDVVSPHPDVSVWEIYDRDEQAVGLFYLDPFARAGKRSGAWMSAYRVQGWDDEKDERIPPLILNTCNFLKPGKGEPCLLSLNEARTLFHEFGHGMHGLASRVKYKGLAGTSVVRDFVEFPSQLNERWLTSPELRERFCTHINTGEPLPATLIEKMEAASNAGSGFATLEYLASAVVDLSLHLEGKHASPHDVEERVLGEWGLPSQVVMRHRTPQFAHIFSGESYASGYYCYLWADTLVADATELFNERGFYDQELCLQYYDQVLSQGHAVDSSEAFRVLRGRDPRVEPLLKDRGLI